MGGALRGRYQPSGVDKAAYILSNFVTPAPSFAALGKILAGQAVKGVTDNIDYYRRAPPPIKAYPKPKTGLGIPIPFPFVDFKKAWNVLSNPNLFKGPEVSAKEGRAIVAEYKRQYADYKNKGGTRSYGSWIKWKGYGAGLAGGSLDLHKAIGKLPKPKKGFTLPGHKYTGPYNPLEKQVKWDPNTGQILEIYDKPTGSTDAIAMQHDVDYSVCKDDVKCKNKADQKMVKALDAVPYNERQWGHWLARNAINSKQKLGLGVQKNGKSRRVKKTGKKN